MAVGRAGGAGSVPEFGFEGFRETGWTGKEKETMRTKKKKKKIDSGGQKDADTYLQETSAEDANVANNKALSTAYIWSCAFIFLLLTR